MNDDLFLEELKNYIIINISTPNLNVKTIIKHFGISRTQFYRKMEEHTSVSLSQYIRSIRLENALELLNANELNLTEIAYAVGFSSLSHFSKTFKKVYGKTPSEWQG